MALAVDRANLLVDAMSSRMTPVRDALLLVGLYYTSKKVYGGLYNIYTACKTFGLPYIWPRNFPQEYGQWAVVTGCTRGIGLCYAQELAKRGMNIILVGRNSPALGDIADDIKAECKEVKVEFIEADFSKGHNVYKAIETGLVGKDIGILVNNVGVIPPHPMYFTEISEDVLWNLVNVNVAAATQMMRIVLPKMEAKKKGAIINLASSAALSPQPLVQVYTATKAYMDFLSEALSYEYSRKGITIQTVSPMYVCTSMVAFSDNLNTPSLLVPSPEAFTAQAVRTLGFASKTTGYWSHSLQTGFMDFFILPKIWLSKILNERFRSEALRRK